MSENLFLGANSASWASQVALLVKNPLANAEDTGAASSIPGAGNGDSLQYSCLDSMDRGEPGGLQSMGLQRTGQD